MQVLFSGSEEGNVFEGLGLLPSMVKRFKFSSSPCSVPHMGWNSVKLVRPSQILRPEFDGQYVYFDHSYCALQSSTSDDSTCGTTFYGDHSFVSIIENGSIFATQFHPEKSGSVGLAIFERFLSFAGAGNLRTTSIVSPVSAQSGLAKRIIACLDVRTDDDGRLVVTKGDQYDVREGGLVRNLGDPVDLARYYYEEGADEITFLNITSYRSCPLKDAPLLEVLRATSKNVFVPLTIGGGIRDVTDPDGTIHSAVEVAGEYFRSGADKVSIGSDAVLAAEGWLKTHKCCGTTSIEQIASRYGTSAVVISIDPVRVYLQSPRETSHHVVELPESEKGPKGEGFCWYQCTIKGGRERRDIDVVQMASACEALGAGEILLNSIDRDGTNRGFDVALISSVRNAVSIPVIASSGAGSKEHFSDLFEKCPVESALAAGIFHRREVRIGDLKQHLLNRNVPVRR